MKILVIGGGGREHAICYALHKSSKVTELYAAPGNGGIMEIAHCLDIDSKDMAKISQFCISHAIDFVVVGPEAPLAAGIIDHLTEHGIKAFGPSQKAAILEASKSFTKMLCTKYNIPTAKYADFTDADAAKKYIKEISAFPLVIKADGLAAGKGVIIAENAAEALAAIDDLFSGKFGEAGNKIVIEEFLIGKEVSVFALCDGKNAIYLGAAEDYKRIGDGDTGLNTGGMGCVAPSPLIDEDTKLYVMSRIINPTIQAMNNEGRTFKGILFAGLMLTREGPKLLEYNVRLGDPETEAILPLLKTDFAEIIMSAYYGNLQDITVEYENKCSVAVVMASQGYPGAYQAGSKIANLDQAEKLSDVIIFHAGTEKKNGNILATGGRVLVVTAIADNFEQARTKAYQAVSVIDWPQGYYRKDIALKVIRNQVQA